MEKIFWACGLSQNVLLYVTGKTETSVASNQLIGVFNCLGYIKSLNVLQEVATKQPLFGNGYYLCHFLKSKCGMLDLHSNDTFQACDLKHQKKVHFLLRAKLTQIGQAKKNPPNPLNHCLRAGKALIMKLSLNSIYKHISLI